MTELNETVHFAASNLEANQDSRTLRGRLFKWGEVGHHPVLGDFAFEKGSVQVPDDASSVHLNLHHDPKQELATAVRFEEAEDGLYAEFSIQDNILGNRLLNEYAEGRKKSLSAEVKKIVVDGSKAVRATLTGAAVVALGAFPSASFSLAETEAIDPAVAARIAELEARLAALETPEEEETSEETPEEPTTTEKEDTVSTVSNTNAAEAVNEEKDTDLTGLFSLINKAQNSFGAEAKEAEAALFALSDIHYDKTGTNNSLGAPIRQPAYIGELWSGRSYERKVIPLVQQGTLRAIKNTGWRWTSKPTVAVWSGNKTEIPSSTGAVEPYTYNAVRYAGGWDIAREYVDFGETAIIESFLQHAVNDYARKSDDKVLADMIAAATEVEGGDVPAGVAAGLGRVVEGALAVIDAGASATSALVAPDVFREIVFTKEQDRLAFIGSAFGLEDGQTAGFRVVPHAGLAAGDVLVFDRQAVTAEELSGSPIRVNAQDLARGGYDEALFAYIATRIDLPEAIVRVTAPVAP